MKTLKKETHPSQRTTHKVKQKKNTLTNPNHKNQYTHNPPLNSKLQKRTRLENQIPDRKDKKFSILLLLGRDMEKSPIQGFLHIGITNTAIYLERKLSLTIPGKAEEQSSVWGFESIFLKENNFQNPQATEVSHWICITELNVLKLLKIFWPRLRTGRCWCFYSLVFDLVNSYNKVIQNPLNSRKAWPTYCIERSSHWKSIGYKDRNLYPFFYKIFQQNMKKTLHQTKKN